MFAPRRLVATYGEEEGRPAEGEEEDSLLEDVAMDLLADLSAGEEPEEDGAEGEAW